MPNREQRRNGEGLSDTKFKVVIGGNPYEWTMADISGLDEFDYKAATGSTFQHDMATGEISIITIAGFVWCLRRRYEKKLTLREVLAEIDMSDLETVEVDDGSEEEEVPEPAYDGKDPERSGGPSVTSALGSPASTG